MSLLSQLSLDPNLVGSLTLKRPDGRRAEAALFRLRLRLRRDRVVAKRRRRRAAKAEGRDPRTDNSCTGSGHTPEAFLWNRVGQASRLPAGGEADGVSALSVAPERTRGRRDACPTLGPIRFRVAMRERISADALGKMSVDQVTGNW